ncbi:MAG: cyanophycinase [Acidobacteria bacterium]|nr:cyanophycinase [Acidobacteriota bacterium]
MAPRSMLGLILAGLVVFPPPLVAQQVGPARGSLVLVGGSMQDPAIVERFLDLAGGPDAPIVLIPTAGGAESYDGTWRGTEAFRASGATRLAILHTTDRDTANTEAFVEPLRHARGVWFGGGRQWRLADAYLDTKVHEALREVLDRGGVIGGSSAGATILGSYLVRGDTRTNTIMMGDHEEGFGLLRGVGVDQHLLRRNRQFDLIEVVRARPDLLGIGIDEDTAIVVQGDRFEVIGRSYVAIYDRERLLDSGGLFYLLAPGDVYDLAAREAYRPQPALGPLDRVVAGPWPDAPH